MGNGLKILITGDFYSRYRIEELIKQYRFAEIFNDFLPIISEANIAITNLESPLTNSNLFITKTGPALKANPKTIEALKFAGFNMVTLANNHTMDYGKVGLKDTIDLCLKNNIDIVGAGMNYQEASKTVFKEVGKFKLAFVNFAENEWSTTNGENAGTHPLNPIANYFKIKEASDVADFVFVIVHGGHEMYELPSPRMKETYRFFVDAGASAVIGHHTHCYSGYEVYKESPIFYSLGNFVFDSAEQGNQEWYTGFAVKFSIKQNFLTHEIIPYKQCKEKPGVFLLTGEENQQFTNRIAELCKIIQNDKVLKENFQIFCNKEAKISYNVLLEPHSNRIIHFLQRRGFLPSFLSRRKKMLFENLIRCEAHRDAVLEILKR